MVRITPKLVVRLIAAAVFMFVVACVLKESMKVRLGAALLGVVIVYVLTLSAETRKKKYIGRSYDMDLPDFLTHVSMFTEAGIGIWDAIERSAEIGNADRPLYKDIKGAFESVRKGAAKDIMSAFEDLSDSRKSAALSNLCATVIQNVRKGSSELSSIFASQAQLYRNERRRIAGKMADEAVTLLTIPSALVLIAMIILLLAPAVMEMFGGM